MHQLVLIKKEGTLKKEPDLLHWLSKTGAICNHSLRIANVAISTNLAQWLLDEVEVQPIHDPQPIQPFEGTITKNALETVLNEAGCTGVAENVGQLLNSICEVLPNMEPQKSPPEQIGAICFTSKLGCMRPDGYIV